MMSTILTPLVLAISSVAFAPSTDEPGKPGARASLASFEELQGRLGAPDLRILDARAKGAYEKGHLPGAVWVDPKAVEARAAQPGVLTDRESWETWIRPLGIGPETMVLVYDDNRQLDAARVWWLLGYLGVERVGLVDGGFALWSSEGRPVTQEDPKVEPRPFPVSFHAARRASRAEVLAAVEARSARIIDARSEAEYTGEDKKSRRGGHVPAACHLEWKNFVKPDGRFPPLDEIREKVVKAGVKPGEPVITHCQGGGRAAVDAFVFERLGHPSRNYYESWADWGNAEDTPVETGSKD